MDDECAKYDDLINLLCGELLGSGISRKVFACKLNPKWVVKVEYEDYRFQNLTEWRLWEDVCEWKEMAKWFAPCRYISPSGKILIQERTEPIRLSDIPNKVPAFFTDMKLDNYGMIGGQLVWHDYGTFIMTNGLSKRMKKHDFNKDF